ncbi:protein phosphatase 1 regulatory subunit 12A isoform X3 [Folsomia candida]|uniref:protein phosphatase 1 regulatory subunit 12A isoform X3 n=1 Tax=Folsomia candida TaxID=158441 RepID=UPI000B8F8CEC|nr:protein phosphatase 1 regulatory subunit 12A isoform X3 [Folsomia candida]
MTLGGQHSQSESVMLAYNKRKAQLDRWKESETDKESHEIKNRPKRVKFADKCIFQAACAANDKLQVAKMIKDGYDINAVDEDGITALHQACIEDNLEMVEFLLKHGSDVNISDNEGWTPLHAVATCCYVSIAKVLLEHGANVTALNNDCSIPLDICKSDEIREIFIQDINAKGIDLKEARRGEELRMVEDVKRWSSNGYSEEPHPITGATALHVAACKGYIKVLDQIIKAGANINVTDVDGWTALHAAAHWGQKEACEILLENNCDTSIKDSCDQTALEIADSSVLPVFEQFKRKRDINKNLEKTTTNIHLVGPVIQIQRKPTEKDKLRKEEPVKIIQSDTEMTESNQALLPEHKSAADFGEKSKPLAANLLPPSPISTSTAQIIPTTSSSTDTFVTTALQTYPTGQGEESMMTSEENSPSWRRTSSLRSKTITVPGEEVVKEKLPVRRTKAELISTTDTSLRRAYSFESDPKFYTRLRDARNRIKASNSSALSTNTAILEHIPTVTSPTTASRILPPTIPTHPSSPLLPTSFNEITSSTDLCTTNNNNQCALITSKLQEGFEGGTVPTRFTQNRTKDADTVNATTTGSPSLPNRGSQQDVKVRSSNDGHIVYGSAKVPGPVSKFKQFLFKLGDWDDLSQNQNLILVSGSFVPPTRDEESETQRKAHAKRVRETRRSTQGVTLEELKSAEQYVKNSLLGTAAVASTEQATTPVPTPVPAIVPTSRKEDEASVERRPSWRLRIDETDPSKFSLEDTRSLPPTKNSGSGPDMAVQRSSSLRNRVASNRSEHGVHGKPPKPPEGTEMQTNKNVTEDEKEKDMKNSGAQGAILRKKKTKRRSTGIVQYNQDVGSGPSSDLDQPQDSSKSENGVNSAINYRKLYEEVLKENQLLKGRLTKAEEDMTDLKVKMERVSLTPRITSEDADRREKRALERKLSEMEEELKQIQKLKLDNEKLKAENRALTRVVSKLSGASAGARLNSDSATPTGNGPKG